MEPVWLRLKYGRMVQATVLAATLLAVSIGVAAQAAQPQPSGKVPRAVLDLFTDAETPAHLRVAPQAIKHRAARVNFQALRQAKAIGAQLRFNLFPDMTFTGLVEAVEARSQGEYTLVGRLEVNEFSSFVVVVNQDVMVMNLRPGRRGLLQVRYVGDGIHSVLQIDERLFPPCGTTAASAVGSKILGQQGTQNPNEAAKEEGGDLIDVMVVYTPAARVAVGGTAAMEALINLAFTESNTAFNQSLITPRIRLVRKREVPYTESSSFSVDLERLRHPADGYMDEVHTLRNGCGADLVSLWVDENQYCGMAYLLTSLSTSFEAYAFSLVHHGCATGYYSFSHELAHNMGCFHDREHSTSQGLYTYSYGWRFFGTDGELYRTIMAHFPGTRIQGFSNPNVSYDGVPTGVPLGATNEANNALTINNSAFTVANFRAAVISTNREIFPDPAPRLHLRAVMFSEQAGFQLSVEGPWPGTYILEVSTNLTSWTPVQTNTDTLGTIYFLDASATNFGRRFYRAFYR